MPFIPQKVIDDIGEAIIEDEISNNLTQLSSFDIKDRDHIAGDIYCYTEICFTILDKVIQNPNITFYKLFTPDFELG
jgi:hypothetical protein